MNLILFEPFELSSPLPRSDPRALHILDVLRRTPGDQFDVGVVNGPRGKGTLLAAKEDSLDLSFSWGSALPALSPLAVLIGLPRPQTARKILHEATTFGVTALHFVATERSEGQYAQSSLWSSGEWRRHLLAGAAQAFDTRLPVVTWTQSLAAASTTAAAGDSADGEVGGRLFVPGTPRIALDNYEASHRLSECAVTPHQALMIAIGPERGWGPRDRDLLRHQGFVLAHLGQRVLRTETAVLATLAIIAAKIGLM